MDRKVSGSDVQPQAVAPSANAAAGSGSSLPAQLGVSGAAANDPSFSLPAQLGVSGAAANDPSFSAPGASSTAPAPQSNLDHTKITGRFNQYTSGYWALTVPLLSARYVFDALNEMFKPISKIKFPKWGDKAWSIGVGGLMMGVTGFYSIRTYTDMKRQFKEPLGWEFDKDPEKVGIRDMLRTQNTLVRDAVKNFTKRSVMRVAANLPFFTYLVPTPFKQRPDESPMRFERRNKLLGPKGSVNFGVGVNAMYLATDALSRKRTFFEELQGFIDTKINHRDKLGDSVTAQDLINLYALRQRDTKAPPLPKMNTPQWQDNVKLFDRMADLMNQTYENIPQKEHADFTVPKLLYLLGMGLLKSDNLEKNLAYVEVANRYGVPALKKVASAVEGGADLNTALSAFPIPLSVSAEAAPEQPAKSFAQEGLKKSRPEAPAATHAERALQKGDGMAQSVGA